MKRRLLLFLFPLLLLAPTVRAADRTLTIFAAASLTDAFTALQPEFERAHPEWKVRYEFGASSTLRAQIQQGAPAEAFASADQEQMQALVTAKAVLAPKVFAHNRLVVVFPARNPGNVRALQDLARFGLRFVTAAEGVPIEQYTQQVLRNLSGKEGLPADYAQQVNRNIVSRETNVRSVLAKVELGEADAALVYETDARSAHNVRTLEIPVAANVIAEYPVAVVAAGANHDGAEAFVSFLTSSAGKKILQRYGFR